MLSQPGPNLERNRAKRRRRELRLQRDRLAKKIVKLVLNFVLEVGLDAEIIIRRREDEGGKIVAHGKVEGCFEGSEPRKEDDDEEDDGYATWGTENLEKMMDLDHRPSSQLQKNSARQPSRSLDPSRGKFPPQPLASFRVNVSTSSRVHQLTSHPLRLADPLPQSLGPSRTLSMPTTSDKAMNPALGSNQHPERPRQLPKAQEAPHPKSKPLATHPVITPALGLPQSTQYFPEPAHPTFSAPDIPVLKQPTAGFFDQDIPGLPRPVSFASSTLHNRTKASNGPPLGLAPPHVPCPPPRETIPGQQQALLLDFSSFEVYMHAFGTASRKRMRVEEDLGELDVPESFSDGRRS